MIYQLLDHIIGNMLINESKKTPRCKICRTRMIKSEKSYLFLLPLFHDQKYETSPEYYIKNCKPIKSLKEIPTGQRACQIWIINCPDCGNSKVLLQDFLRVRGENLTEYSATYNYQELEPLLP